VVAEVILGIETSCDETSSAVLAITAHQPSVKGLVILTQDVHRVFGGVVPELASRAHLAALPAVVDGALAEAGVPLTSVDAIAVTQGPGLVGALLVGVMFAKGLALRLDRPLVGVHHLEAHLFAATLDEPDLDPPFVALLVSGGHTMLLDVRAWGDYRLLGETRDDAAGEAFDKVAALLGLGFPGGPEIERLAAAGDPRRFAFPRPMLADGYEFSFSGLKTAVLHAVRRSDDLARDRADLAASFQAAALEVLVAKTARAIRETGHTTAVLGGGVACSQTLARLAREKIPARVVVAQPRYNADNAAMIASAGWYHLARGERAALDLDARADLAFPGLVSAKMHARSPA